MLAKPKTFSIHREEACLKIISLIWTLDLCTWNVSCSTWLDPLLVSILWAGEYDCSMICPTACCLRGWGREVLCGDYTACGFGVSTSLAPNTIAFDRACEWSYICFSWWGSNFLLLLPYFLPYWVSPWRRLLSTSPLAACAAPSVHWQKSIVLVPRGLRSCSAGLLPRVLCGWVSTQGCCKTQRCYKTF